MGVEALVARLEEEARREADALLAEARERAAGLRREAEREARAREERWRRRRERELRSEAEGRVAEARREARRRVLEAREELLGRVRAEALRRLDGDGAADAYRGQAPGRLRRALAYLGRRDAVARCRPSVAATLAAAGDGGRASPGGDGEGTPALEVVEDPGAPVGLLVSAADGSIRVDDTLPERLRRAWEELAVEVVAAAAAGDRDGPTPPDGAGRGAGGGP